MEQKDDETQVQNWNNNIEKLVLNIGIQSFKYRTIHFDTANKFNSRQIYLTTTLIILSPFTGVLSALTLYIRSNLGINLYILDILSIILSFIAGILISIIKFGKYEEISNAHKIASSRYTSLANNVKRQLSLNRKNRISAKEYLEWLTNSSDQLYSSSPLITAHVDETDIVIQIDNENDHEKIESKFDLASFDDKFMNYQLSRFNT